MPNILVIANAWTSLFELPLSIVSQFSHLAATLAVNLLMQTTLVLVVGLVAAWMIRRRGAALQSCVLRMTLVATLFCPVASWLLYTTGISGFRIELALLEDLPKPPDESIVPTETTPPLNPIEPIPTEIVATSPMMSDTDRMPHSFDRPSTATVGDFSPNRTESIEDPVITEIVAVTPEIPEEPLPVKKSESARLPLSYLAICSVWIFFSGTMLLRLVIANLMMEGLRRKSRLAPENVVCDCHDIARQMSVNAPPVLVNERLSSPCLLGWLRPAVMIPANLRPISPDVLAHELAHLRRNDCFWSLLGHLTTAMMPWQPLAWLLNRRMEQAADNVCDDYVVAHNFDRVSYARELVTIAERFPASWTSTTAAVGIAEFQSCLGNRVQRILDGSRTLSLRTGWKNLILVMFAALLGTLIAGFLGASRAPRNDAHFAQLDDAGEGIVASSNEIATTVFSATNDQSGVANTPERDTDVRAESKTSDEIVVKGVVLKPDGTAAAGATVRMGAPRLVDRWSKLEQLATHELITVIADENGRFEIRAKKISTDHNLNGKDRQPSSTLMPIAASLKGFGPTWLDLEGVAPDHPITLELVDDYIVRGQIVDLEGRPVRGTTVTLNRVDRLKGEDLTGFLSKIDQGSLGIAFIQPWNVRKLSIGLWEIGPALIGLSEQVTTDGEGWLEIQGLGKDRLVHLAINGGDFAYKIVTVASRNMETIQPVGVQKQRAISEPIYGAPCKIAVEPTRPIEGTVMDAATGDPIAGVTIGIRGRFEMEFALRVKTMSDSAGRFRLLGLAKQSEIQLRVIPNEEQPYFGRTIEVPDAPGIEPLEMKVSLHRGLWIKGRVTNKLTHEPVAGVHLHYYPLLSNDFAQRLPKSDQDGDLDKDDDRFQSNQDGSYRLLGLPGPAVVGAENQYMRFRRGVGLDEIQAPRDKDTNELLTWGQMNGPSVARSFTIQEINPGADEREVRLNLELDPGHSVKIRVIDEAGVPVKGAEVFPGTQWQEKDREQDDGVRIVENLAPDEKRVVYAHHGDRDLGLKINLEPPYDAGREITVVLRPLAKIAGRLLDVGEPMSGLTVNCSVPTKRGSMQILSAWSTDQEGRFRIPVMPGHEYELYMHDGGKREFYAQYKQPLTFSPGEIKDLGDLELKGHEFHSAKPNLPAAKSDTNETGLKRSPRNGSNLIAQSGPEASVNYTNQTDAAEKSSQPSPNAKLPKEILVTGVVLKPDGTPAAGATIRSGAAPSAALERRMGRQFHSKINESIADASGRFSISMKENPYEDTGSFVDSWRGQKNSTVVAASLKGYGPSWLQFDEIVLGQPVMLRLVDDVPIRGQIVDLEGTPVRGTTVTPAQIYGMKGNDLAEFFSKLSQIPIVFRQPPVALRRLGLQQVDGKVIGLPDNFTTDQDGWLEIRGLGKDRLIHLAFTGGDVAYRVVVVANREMETVQLQGGRRANNEPIHGSKFKIATQPSRPVEGVVIDADSGQPLPGISIEIAGNSDSPLTKTLTDQQGRFRALGLPKAAQNRLTFVATDDRPYFPTTVSVPNPPGLEPVEMNVKLHCGIWIKGRVTDKVTHAPVVGIHLHYYPLLSNEYAARVPTFRKGGNMESDRNRYQTDASGSYRLIGLPGPAIVGTEHDFMRYRPGVGFDEAKTPKDAATNQLLTWKDLSGPRREDTFLIHEINPRADEKEIQLDLEIDPGISTTIRLVDPQGSLVKGASVFGTGVRRRENGSEPANESDDSEEGIAYVDNLGPNEKRILHAFQLERNLGLKILLEPPYENGRDHDFVLQPLASVTGRLLEAGEPMRDIAISSIHREDGRAVQMLLHQSGVKADPRLITDAEGRFRVSLIPGHEYELQTQDRSMGRNGSRFTPIAGKLNVRAGETIDLGDLELDKDRFQPVKQQVKPATETGNEPDNSAPQNSAINPPNQPASKSSLDKTTKIDLEKPKEAATANAESPDQILVTGVVLKPDGTPAVGAVVRSAAQVWADLKSALQPGFIPKMTETKADADGQFSISISTQPFGELKNLDERWLEIWKETQIAASLPGFGPAWLEYKNIEQGKPIELRLVDDLPIRGRVVDLEGNPIVGFKVKIGEVSASKNEDISSWLARIKTGEPPWTVWQHAARHTENRLINFPESVTTDDKGWLNIAGMGKERLAELVFEGENVAHQAVTVVSRNIEPTKRVISSSPSQGTEHVFGAQFQFAVAPSRSVEGIIVDSATGEPLSDVAVESDKLANYPYSGDRVLKSVSDASGRFRLVGFPKADGNRMMLRPNDDQPYFMRAIDIPNPTGIEPITMKIELHRGIWIKGRITDKSTHEPVAGVRLHYFPYRTNEFAQKLPEFSPNGNVDGDQYRYTTDREGYYRLVGLPGSAIVGAESIVKSYRNGVGYDEIKGLKESSGYFITWRNPINPGPGWPSLMKEINPSANQQELRLDLELDPGLSASLRIVDENHKLVTGATIIGLGSDSYTPDSKEAVKSIIGLGKDETRILIVKHDGRKIGAVKKLEPPHSDGSKVTIQLVPFATITGRLLKMGDALPGVEIRPDVPPSSGFNNYLLKFTTDSEGQFRAELLTGCKYNLSARGTGIGVTNATIATDLEIVAGETKDLGDLTLGKDGKFEPVKVAAKIDTSQANPAKEQQLQVAGSVVDPDGKPVANAKIYAGGWQRGVFPERNATLITTTDQAGNFRYNVPANESIENWKHRHIYAVSDGFGFAGGEATNLEATGTLKASLSPEEVRIADIDRIGGSGTILRLTHDDSPLTGRIINAEGQPASGIRVRITEVWQSKQGHLDSWEKTATEKTADYYSLRNQAPEHLISTEAPSIINDGLTDGDGRFVLKGIGRDRVVKLVISGPGIELAEFHARTRKGETIVVPHQWDSSPDRKETYFAPGFVHVVSVSVPVIGQVIDVETGKPIAGVRVGNGYQGFWTMRGSRHLVAITDSDGRYRLDGLSVNKSHEIYAFPQNESLHLPARTEVSTKPGQAEVVSNIKLRAGVLLSGRAVDARTSEPISGHVSYYAFYSNEHLKDFPGFRLLRAPHERGADADGRFTIPVMPGAGILTFGPKDSRKYSRGQGADSIKESSELPVARRLYNTVPYKLHTLNTIALQKVDIPIDTGSTEVSFQIHSGFEVSGNLVDENGKPVTGAIATGQDGFGNSW